MLQKRLLRRAKIVAVILGVAAVIAILFLIGGYSQYIEAQRQEQLANEARVDAINQRDEAQKQKAQADIQRNLAEKNEALA